MPVVVARVYVRLTRGGTGWFWALLDCAGRTEWLTRDAAIDEALDVLCGLPAATRPLASWERRAR